MQSPSRDFTSFNNLFSFLPSYDRHELRQAFYNTVAILIVLIVGVTAFAVYCILEVFIRPLLWALLVGVCLHPFKSRLTNALRRWLNSLDTSGTPLVLSLTTLPINVISFTAEFVFASVIKYAKILLLSFIALPLSYFFYHYAPLNRFMVLLLSCFELISSVLNWFSTFWFFTLILGYFGAVLFFWNPVSAVWLERLSIPVWILMLIHVASISGPLRVPLFLALIVLLIVGRISLIGKDKVNKTQPSGLSCFNHFWKFLRPKPAPLADTKESCGDMDPCPIPEEEEEEEEEPEDEGISNRAKDKDPLTGGDAEESYEDEKADGVPETIKSTTPPHTSGKSDDKESASIPAPRPGKLSETDLRRCGLKKKSTSFPYFICLFWAHVAVYLWTHAWVVQLLPIPIAIVGIKKLCSRLGGRAALHHYVVVLYLKVEVWLGDRVDALAPAPIRGIFKLLLRGDKKICRLLDSTIDSVVSVFVILLVFFGTIALTLFLAFQINRESAQLVTMTSEVLNNTMHSDLLTWLPQKENVQQLLESTLGNAYVFGREWISKKIEQFFDTDSYNKVKIEEQVLELWDRLYQRVITKNISTTRDGASYLMRGTSISSLPATFHGLWETLWTFELLSFTHVMEFIKENLGIFMSVFESVWLLLKGNLSLCLSVISAIFSIVLGGSTALLNFLLSTIIFSTTLFYLLAFSNNNFLPVELIGQYFYTTEDASPHIARVFHAVENGVSGVFTASLKMAVFYGFYTLLTHLIFGVSLVVIPSVLAAMFAAVPFLGTYWAALPAIIELSLVYQEPAMGVALLACHLVPTYLVDVSIYKEIQGAGHPYLTGLAIAGGIYYFGLEGAIIGPILLCFLLVAVNLYSNLLVSDASTFSRNRSNQKQQFARSS